MTEYRLIEENDPHKLTESVTYHLFNGWELYGSPMVMAYGDEWHHYQAVTKHLPNTPKE